MAGMQNLLVGVRGVPGYSIHSNILELGLAKMTFDRKSLIILKIMLFTGACTIIDVYSMLLGLHAFVSD